MDVSDVIRPADMTEAHVLAIANKLKEQTKGRLRAIEPMHGGLTIEVVFQNAVSQLCGGPEHGPYIGGCTTHLAYEPRLEQCYKENTSGRPPDFIYHLVEIPFVRTLAEAHLTRDVERVYRECGHGDERLKRVKEIITEPTLVGKKHLDVVCGKGQARMNAPRIKCPALQGDYPARSHAKFILSAMHVPLPGEMHGYQAILLQIIPEVVGCLFYHLINELKLTPLPPIPDDPMIQARRDEYERKTANEARMQWIDEHPDAEEQPPFLPPPTQQEEDDLKEEVREREAILQQWKERQEQVGCVEWFYDKTEMNTMNRIFYLRIMPGRCARISRPGRLVLDLATGLYTGDEGDVGKQ